MNLFGTRTNSNFRRSSRYAITVALLLAAVTYAKAPIGPSAAAESPTPCPAGQAKQTIKSIDFGAGTGTGSPAADNTNPAISAPEMYSSFNWSPGVSPTYNPGYSISSTFPNAWFTPTTFDATSNDVNGRFLGTSFNLNTNNNTPDDEVVAGIQLPTIPAGTRVYASMKSVTSSSQLLLRVVQRNFPSATASVVAQQQFSPLDGAWTIYEIEYIQPAGAGPFALEVIGLLPEVVGNDGGIDDIAIRVCGSATLDYGDAPDPTSGTAVNDYQTADYAAVADDLRPVHTINQPLPNLPTYKLGASVTGESNANLAGGNATGDGGDDGITIRGAPLQDEPVQIGSNATFEGKATFVNTTSRGFVNAWMDFNRDGDFVDSGEQLATNLVPGIDGSFSIVASVPVSMPNNSATYVRVRYSSNGGIGPTGNAIDGEVEDYRVTAFTTMPIINRLVLTKTSSYSGTGAIGQLITYSFSLQNTGTTTLTLASVSDPVLGINNLATTPATLAPGAIGTATATLAITQSHIDAGKVTNSATGQALSGVTSVSDISDSGNPADQLGTNADPTITLIPFTRQIELVKTSTLPGTIQSGQTINYTFSVTNTGTTTVTGLSITDPRLNISNLAVSPATLAPGQVGTALRSYTLTQADIDAGHVTNTATATGTSGGATVTDTSSNATGGGSTPTVTSLSSQPALRLIKSSALVGEGVPGDLINYTFSVTNTGNVTMSGVNIDDVGMGFTDLVVSPATLAPGQTGTATASHTLTLAEVMAGEVVNTASAGGTSPTGSTASDVSDSGNPADEHGTGHDTTHTIIPNNPSMALVKSSTLNGPGNIGDTITYTFRVTNTGNRTIGSISIDDPTLGVVDLPISPMSLQPGQIGLVTLNHVLTQPEIDSGEIVNTATATGAVPTLGTVVTDNSDSGNPADDQGTGQDPTHTLIPHGPALSLLKTADPDFSTPAAMADDTITYTFSVTNTGNVTVNSIDIADLRIGVTNLALSPHNLAPGQTGTATFVYHLTQTDIDSGNVTNTATVAGIKVGGGDVEDDSHPSNPAGDAPTITPIPAAPSLSLLKGATTDFSAPATSGDTITYLLMVTNNGNVTINDVTIDDGRIGASGIAITPDTLMPGQSGTATVIYEITQADIDAGQVSNTATAMGTGPGGVPAEDDSHPSSPTGDAPTITPIPAAPSLSLIKTSDPEFSSPTQPGDDVTYNFTVTNNGNVTISDLKVTDPRVGAIDLPVVPAVLPPGQSGTAEFIYNLSAGDIEDGEIINTATVTGTRPGGGLVEDESHPTNPAADAPTVTPVPQNPKLSIIKTAATAFSNPLRPDDTITYTFDVTNTGNVTVNDIDIADPRIGISDLALTPTVLAPGATGVASATYEISQDDIEDGEIVNTATVTGAGPGGGLVEDESHPTNPAADAPTVTPLAQTPRLSLIKTRQLAGTGEVGDQVTYTFDVTNTGNVIIEDIGVTDPLTGAEDLLISPTNLAPGDTGTATTIYLVTQTDIDAGLITNSATASGKTLNDAPVTDISDSGHPSDDTGANDDPTKVPLARNASIGLMKRLNSNADNDGNGTLSAGDVLTYELTATNTGNVTLTAATVTDPMLASVTCLPASGTIAPNASMVCSGNYTIALADIDAGRLDNTATVTANPPAGMDSISDTSSVTLLPPQSPSIILDKTVSNDGSGGLNPGDTVTFTFTVTNNGNVTMTAVRVVDPTIGIDGLINTDLNCATPNGNDSLAPTQHAVCTADFMITQDVVDHGMTNTAVASGLPPAGARISSTDSQRVKVAEAPGLTVTKSSNPDDDDLPTGSQITYTITLANTGNVTLRDVRLVDDLLNVDGLIDSDLDSACVSPNDNGLNDADELSPLEPNNLVTCTFVYTVTQEDKDAGAVLNSVNAFGISPSDQQVTGSDSTQNSATQVNGISLLKELASNEDEDSSSSITVDDTLTYRLTITNTGNVTLMGTTLDDPRIGLSGLIDGALADECSTPSDDHPILAANTLGVTPATNTATCELTYVVTQNDIDGGAFDNVATATALTRIGVEVTDTASAIAVPFRIAALDLDKTIEDFVDNDDSGNITIGDGLRFTIEVHNVGNLTMQNITVSDPLVGPVDCDETTLAPGDTAVCSAIYSPVTQADIDRGGVRNSASSSGTPPAIIGDPTPVESPTETVIFPIPRNPSIAIEKHGDASNVALAGDETAYTFEITNTGNTSLEDVRLTDALLAISAVAIDDPTCTPPVSGADLRPTLSPGQTVTCSAALVVSQIQMDAGQVLNTASVRASQPTDLGGNATPPVTDSDGETVTFETESALELIKSATPDFTDPPSPDGVISYRFSVVNTGNVTITNPTINDPRINATNIAVTPTTLAPGQTGTATTTYTLTQPDIDTGNVTNTAEVTGTDPDGGTPITDTSDNGEGDGDDPTITNIEPHPELTLTKTSEIDDDAKDGDEITYHFSVVNTGNVTITNPTINDPRINATNIAVTPTTLAPGQTGTATTTYTLTQPDIDTGNVTNTAEVTGTDPDGGTPITDTSDNGEGDGDDPTITNIEPHPELTLTKTSEIDDDAKDGDEITYHFSVVNTGNVTITNPTINDPRINATNIAVTPTTLAPGQTGTATTTYTLTQPDIDTGNVTNTAEVTGTDPDGGTPITDTSDNGEGDGDDPTITNIEPHPELTLIKTADPQFDNPPAPGDAIIYRFSVVNTGNVTITNPTINDPRINATNIAVTPTTLAPGQTGTATTTYTLTQPDIDTGNVTNTAEVTGTDPDGGTPITDTSDNGEGDGDDPTITNIEPHPELTLIKTADPQFDNPPAPGDAIIYRFSVVNTGNVTITNPTINDPRINATNIAVTPTTLAPGQTGTATTTYTLTQPDIDTGNVTNTAEVTGTDPDGGTPITDTSDNGEGDGDDPTIVAVPRSPRLQLSKTAVTAFSSPPVLGDEISYRFSVVNTGNVTITNPTINDPRINATNIAVTPTTLAPGQTGTATTTYTLTQPDIDTGNVTNTAEVTGTDPDGGTPITDTSDNGEGDGDDPTITNIEPHPELTLTKTSEIDDDAKDGDEITYHFSVVNTGNVTITNPTINDPRINATNIAVTPTTLAPGQTGTATTTYTLTQPDIDTGNVTNTAEVTGTDPDGGTPITDTSDNGEGDGDDPTITNIEPHPELTLIKTADPQFDNPPAPGDAIIYRFSVVNTGNVTITNLHIDDARINATNIAVTPTTLAPGQTGTATTTYTLTQPDIDSSEIINTAHVNGDFGVLHVTDVSDPSDPDGDQPTVVAFNAEPHLEVVKKRSDGNDDPNVGDTLSYTLTATNTGNITITDVLITDSLDPTLKCGPQTTLEPGKELVCQAEHRVTDDDMAAGHVTNIGGASGMSPLGPRGTDPGPVIAENSTVRTSLKDLSEVKQSNTNKNDLLRRTVFRLPNTGVGITLPMLSGLISVFLGTGFMLARRRLSDS